MPSPSTRSGTRRLSEVTRVLVKPSGIVTTGWPAVRDKCARDLGVGFDGWQDGAGRLILAKRANGKLAAMVGGVGMSLARQVGKTYLVGALLFALCILRPGLLAIWTAQHSRTSAETFRAMQAFARRRRIAPYVEAVFKGSGDEAIVFRNGSRILFGARERGFGRGIPGVDVLMIDEAQILSERALDNMLATLNTSELGLVLYVGTPPRPEDASEAFVRMRMEALSGEATDMVWIECGADPGCSPDDRKQWAKANPSFPRRTPAESIMRLQKKLTAESFLREGLGVWDDLSGAAIFGQGKWEACHSDEPRPDDLKVGALAVSVSFDQFWASIDAAAVEGDRVRVMPLRHGQGTQWVVAAAKEQQDKHDVDVVVDEKGPAAFLVPALTDAKVRLRLVGTRDVLDACSSFFDLVQDARILHQTFPELERSIGVAVKRNVGDRWMWGRKQSASDISVLDGVTLAAWWATHASSYDVLDSVR